MFAKRMCFIGPSGTSRLREIVRELRARGNEIISFGVREMHSPTSKPVAEAAKRALDEGPTKYGGPQGGYLSFARR